VNVESSPAFPTLGRDDVVDISTVFPEIVKEKSINLSIFTEYALSRSYNHSGQITSL